jgi:hypothetical protein
VQIYVDPNFFQVILPREKGYAGVGGRGVESLTAEPTFYGFLLLIILLYELHSSMGSERTLSKHVVFLILLQLVFVSRSSSALGTLILSYFVYLIVGLSLKRIMLVLFLIASLGVVGVAGAKVLESVRFVKLILLFIESPVSLLTYDLSFNDRFFHVYYSLAGFFDNWMLPHGFESWWEFLQEKSRYNDLVVNVSGDHGRVMSLLGGMLFELGLFAFPFIWVLFSVLYQTFKGSRYFVFVLILFFIITIQAVPLSLPTIPFVLGQLLGEKHRCTKRGSV